MEHEKFHGHRKLEQPMPLHQRRSSYPERITSQSVIRNRDVTLVPEKPKQSVSQPHVPGQYRDVQPGQLKLEQRSERINGTKEIQMRKLPATRSMRRNSHPPQNTGKVTASGSATKNPFKDPNVAGYIPRTYNRHTWQTRRHQDYEYYKVTGKCRPDDDSDSDY